MKALSFLDIHTHRRDQKSDFVSVLSLNPNELLSDNQLPKGFLSAGIHPWWLEDFDKPQIDSMKSRIEELVSQGLLWGVGETGIDRAYPEFLQDQIDLFHWHLELSERFNLPLIIHSVKAGSDFLQILKEKRPRVPWIFHDFRGNEPLLKDLLRLHSMCFTMFRAKTVDSALKIYKGMLGLSGFQMPKGILSTEFMNSIGIKYGPRMINDENLHLGLIMVCFFVVKKYKNSFELYQGFKPTHKLAFLSSIMFVLCIFGLNRLTEFIYFNF